jgi:hypothetical protein
LDSPRLQPSDERLHENLDSAPNLLIGKFVQAAEVSHRVSRRQKFELVVTDFAPWRSPGNQSISN